jgi:hypothetical protein
VTALLDARAKLAAALAPVDDGDPVVLVDLVDAITPPALMLGWAEPWMTPDTGCLYSGRIVVTAVSTRLVPGAGIATLEELVTYTINRLRTSGGAWPLESVGGPRVFVIAKTSYLAARLTFRVKVTT